MKIRCSQLGKIMTNPTKAEANAGEILSKGAKTYLRQIAKERFYQYKLSEEQLKKQIKL